MSLVIADLYLSTCCVLGTRLELGSEDFFDAVGRVSIRSEPFAEIFRLLTSAVRQNPLFTLLAQLLSIMVVQTEFRCSNWTLWWEEIRTHRGFNI